MCQRYTPAKLCYTPMFGVKTVDSGNQCDSADDDNDDDDDDDGD